MTADPDRNSGDVTPHTELGALTRVVDKATEDYSRQLALATEMLRDAGKSFDQTLITLSAGAVAISVTYLRPVGYPTRVLVLAWACFGAALCIALLSFKLVQLPFIRDVDRLSRAIKRSERGLSQASLGDVPAAVEAFAESEAEVVLATSARRWRIVVLWLNAAAVAAFILGVTALLNFTIGTAKAIAS